MSLAKRTVDSASNGFRAMFRRGMESALLTAVFFIDADSSGASETYLIPAAVPEMREWIGDRRANDVRIWELLVRNKDYEASEAIPRNVFEDEHYGIWPQRFQEMGRRAKTLPDKLFAELLVAGFTATGYDGVTFFSTAHPIDGGDDQSNRTDAPLDEDAFDAAMVSLRSLLDNHGAPAEVLQMGRPVLVVPPQLRTTAWNIVEADRLASGAANPNHKRADLLVLDRLASHPTKWFILIGGGAIRPFVRQNRRAAEFVLKDSPNEDGIYWQKKINYGTDCREAMAPIFWRLAFGSTGDAS